MYEERSYRGDMLGDKLETYVVTVEESDLWIASTVDVKDLALNHLKVYRDIIKSYGLAHKGFFQAMSPLLCKQNTHQIIKSMHKAAQLAGVGPMAGVAGAISEFVGNKLYQEMIDMGIEAPEVMVENGGDLFLRSKTKRTIKIYAGDSPLSNKLGIILQADQTPIGVCTSAGRVGHSISYGQADAVCVISKDTVLADALATATGNLIKTKDDIERGINFAKAIQGVEGVIIIIGDQLGLWGSVELLRM